MVHGPLAIHRRSGYSLASDFGIRKAFDDRS
jgi:hypothetical protein